MARPRERANEGASRPVSCPASLSDRVRTVSHMHDTEEISTRLRDAATLPDLLAASFDAFEIVRILVRSCDNLAPEVFAAFMTTADAAVDGREAVTAVTGLPAGPSMACA